MSKSIAEVLEQTLKRSYLRKGLARAKAVMLWSEAVGVGIAKMTKANRQEGNVLIVEAADSTVAHHLSMQRHLFVERLQALMGNDQIQDIRFILGSVTPHTAPKPEKKVKLPKPKKEDIEKLAEHAHPELKKVTLKAAEALLQARPYEQLRGHKPCAVCRQLSATPICPLCQTLSQNIQVQALAKRLSRDPDLQFCPERFGHISPEGLHLARLIASQQLRENLKPLLLEVLQSKKDPIAIAMLKNQAYSAIALEFEIPFADVNTAWHNKLPIQVSQFL